MKNFRDQFFEIADPDLEPLQRLLQGTPDRESLEDTLHRLSGLLSEDTQRRYSGKLLALLLPLEQLVPDCYAEWRPLVRDAVAFIGASLSEKRLLPKLVEQFMFSDEVTLEKRAAAFIAQMPSLQKLGQTIARNRHLNPELRAELILLEDMIRDVSPEQIQVRIRELLGTRMEIYGVELEHMIHAEASVSAVMRFNWINPVSGRREEGVFKVLKPHVPEFYREELDILRQLAQHLAERSREYSLEDVDLTKIFDEIRQLMEREVDSVNEQASLAAARRRFQNISGIRVPRLFVELCAPGITAMSLEQGAKVTAVYSCDPLRRNRLAQRIVEALVAVPLFSADEWAEFHADPHAGNLHVHEESGDLVIFDWAMTEQLCREERRLLMLLVSAVMLRDEYLIYTTLRQISGGSLTGRVSAAVKDQIRRFTLDLSPLAVPGLEHVLALLDALLRTGISFSTPLLIFRKVLLTIDGILHDMELKLPVENVLAGYLLGQETRKFWYLGRDPGAGRMPLSNSDLYSLWWSANWLGLRIGMQAGARLFRA